MSLLQTRPHPLCVHTVPLLGPYPNVLMSSGLINPVAIAAGLETVVPGRADPPRMCLVLNKPETFLEAQAQCGIS